MALSTTAVTVTTTATLLSAADPDGHTVTVKNVGTVDVQIGESDVTAANGLTLSPNEGISFDLEGGVALYGRVASGTVAVRVLRHRV